MSNLVNSGQNDTRFDDAMKRAKRWGSESVKSALSKPNLGMDLVTGVAEGYIETLEQMEQHFEVYRSARAAETAKHVIAQGLNEDNEKSINAQRSKQKQLFDAAKLPVFLEQVDGVTVNTAPDMIHKTIERRKAAFDGGVKVKPSYDCMVDVARAQLASPTVKLDDDTIDKIVAKPEKKDAELVDKLRDEYKRVYNLAEKMGDAMLDCEHIEAARESIADAIRALDGEVPSMSKAQKKDDEMVGFLMSKGMSREQARAIVAK